MDYLSHFLDLMHLDRWNTMVFWMDALADPVKDWKLNKIMQAPTVMSRAKKKFGSTRSSRAKPGKIQARAELDLSWLELARALPNNTHSYKKIKKKNVIKRSCI